MAEREDDSEVRSELEARVYSRSGSIEPRIARFDEASGRVLELTESEWRLLEIESARAGEPVSDSSGRLDGMADDEQPEQRPADVPPARRRRLTPLAAGAIGIAIGAGLLGAWLGLGATVGRSPGFDITIVPTPAADIGAALPAGAALDLFRDPRRGDGVLPGDGMFPGWLNGTFERSDVARVVGPDGAAAGVTVYAAVSVSAALSNNPAVPRSGIACLIVKLETSGMVWNCTSLERVVERGMQLSTAIPRGVGTRTDQDGDGVMGTASKTDVLTVEWRPDGTFVVSRHDP
ncbi:MAG TPA: hypothetical protein VFE99_05240 [Agromyces sp.]|nr:hypothetical protein [Agromyces sp.]